MELVLSPKILLLHRIFKFRKNYVHHEMAHNTGRVGKLQQERGFSFLILCIFVHSSYWCQCFLKYSSYIKL